MIRRLFLKFGPFGAVEPFVFNPTAMTVFVGPNNSGKSLVLREIQQILEQGRTASRHIVDGIEIAVPQEDEIKTMLRGRQAELPAGQVLPEGHIHLERNIPASGSATILDIHFENVLGELRNCRSRQTDGSDDWWKDCWNGIYTNFAILFTIALDGKTRLSLTDERPAGDFLLAPQNHLTALFQKDDARKRVRRIIQEAFGLYFVVDPTNSGRLRVRMASRPPADDNEEQSFDHRARSFHKAATEISQHSDGVKAFTGLISALISSDFKIMLVDEPEAFLHPPLAGQLGREMVTLADERSGNVFASTHSARFLMGCVESGKPINIVRLTYNAPHATARLLHAERIQELMRDPLLRSAGVLDALFYSSAVVCEADKDRVFYSEINNRIQSAGNPSIRDALFLNAQNKQTVRRIVGPLRSMGIPAAAIVDLDIIKGDDLRDLLKACFVPHGVVESLGQLRGNVEAGFRNGELDMKKGGIELLEGEIEESCKSLLDQLAGYGIFAVPNGEVESWLKYLNVEASKQNWLPEMFAKMKSEPNDADYVKPQNNDVWKFLDSVRNWTQDENRRGMPRPISAVAEVGDEAQPSVGIADVGN